MKKINLITSLSPEKQYEIQRWFWITASLFILLLILIGWLLVPSFLLCTKMKKDIALLRQKSQEHTTIAGTKNALKKEWDELDLRSKRVDNYKQQKKNPYQQIAAIVSASGDGVQIESIRLHKKNSEITIVCPTAEHARIFIKRLSASSYFSRLKMISLQQDQGKKQLMCTISGTLIW